MKGGLVGGRFVLLSISNLNLLNTARMKREKRLRCSTLWLYSTDVKSN